MKRCILIILFILISMSVKSQTLSVESFRLLETDLTANTNGTMERDQNGIVAALIKVVTSENGFVFDGGMMGIVKTIQKAGEIWVYVPYGIQKITITHPDLGVLRDYFFPITIERARTYELKLISGRVKTVVEQTSTAQFVVFKVEPKTAVVFVDEDEPRTLDSDGMLSIRLGRGHHTYRVTAASFMPESGAIEVGVDKITKYITLKSAKATLTVNTADDAEIWINEVKKGEGSWTGDLEAGMYLIESRKLSHRSQKQEITLDQQERRTVTISAPTPIYGSLEIESNPLECSVYLDDIYMGETPLMLENILVGDYAIRLEKNGYQKIEADITLEEGKTETQKYTLQQGEYHEYVDLGLSVMWATCNVGATAPEDYGDYYAWGETETKSTYNWSTYKYYNDSSSTITKYNNKNSYGTVDNKTTLELEDDVAHIKWGGNWRMPTLNEFIELINNCTWNFENGNIVFKSKVVGYTDRFIIIPASRLKDDTGMYYVQSSGYYWCSTLSSQDRAFNFQFDAGIPGNSYTNDSKRSCGFSIRPVYPTHLYGSLEIESAPLKCSVYVDNKLMGETPLILDRVLVGDHIIRLEKDGYQKMEARITVEEGKKDTQKYTLQQNLENGHEYVDF